MKTRNYKTFFYYLKKILKKFTEKIWNLLKNVKNKRKFHELKKRCSTVVINV